MIEKIGGIVLALSVCPLGLGMAYWIMNPVDVTPLAAGLMTAFVGLPAGFFLVTRR